MSLLVEFAFIVIAVFGAAIGQENNTLLVSPIKAELGKAVNIPCNYTFSENETFFSIVWKHGGNNVVIYGAQRIVIPNKYEDKVEFDNGNFQLTVLNVAFEDAGEYTWALTTSLGSPSGTEHLQVFAVPDVSVRSFPIVLPGDYEQKRKKESLAECKVTGASPPFTMKWVTFPSRDMIISNSFREESTNLENGELVDASLLLSILPDPIRNNDRKFLCAVEDAFGQETFHEAVADVIVQSTTPPTTTIQASPFVTDFPTEDGATVTMRIGENRNYVCVVTGVPSPRVVWYSGTKVLARGKGRATLNLNVEALDDAAEYTCKGGNNIGRVSKSFKLVVQGSPFIFDEDFINGTKSVTVGPKTEIVTLSCQASAFPVAEFAWEVEGLNLTETNFAERVEVADGIVTSTINLTLFNGNPDSRRVKCIASNSLGRRSKKFIVSKTLLPTANTGIVVGVVIAVIAVLALTFFIVYFTLSSRKRQQANLNSTENTEKGCLSCAAFSGICNGKQSAPEKSSDNEEDEQIKEVREEGTKEEKQKLTEAEQQPAAKEKETDPENESSKKDAVADENKTKKKSRVSFGLQCCHSRKKKLKEESSEHDEESKDVADEGGNANESPEKLKSKLTDGDSGKGDTLEKVVEEIKK